jgi:hypothetical protein
VNATAPTVAIGAPSPAPSATHCSKPLLGVVTLSLGAFLSGLNTRLTTFGLADIRGGVGLGFDEGSWLTAVMTALVWDAARVHQSRFVAADGLAGSHLSELGSL